MYGKNEAVHKFQIPSSAGTGHVAQVVLFMRSESRVGGRRGQRRVKEKRGKRRAVKNDVVVGSVKGLQEMFLENVSTGAVIGCLAWER